MILGVRTIRLNFGNISMHSENVAEKVGSTVYKVGIVCQRRDKQQTAMSGCQQTLDQKLCATTKQQSTSLNGTSSDGPHTYMRQHAITSSSLSSHGYEIRQLRIAVNQKLWNPSFCCYAIASYNSHRRSSTVQTGLKSCEGQIPGVKRVGHREVTMGKRYNNSDRQASLLHMLPSVSSSWCANFNSSSDPPCTHLASNKAARRCNEITAT